MPALPPVDRCRTVTSNKLTHLSAFVSHVFCSFFRSLVSSFVHLFIRSSLRSSIRSFVRPSGQSSLRPSVSPSVCPSESPFVRPSVRSFIRPFVHPSVHPFDCQFDCSSARTFVRQLHWFVRHSDCLSVRPSDCLSVRPSDPSIRPSVNLLAVIFHQEARRLVLIGLELSCTIRTKTLLI